MKKKLSLSISIAAFLLLTMLVVFQSQPTAQAQKAPAVEPVGTPIKTHCNVTMTVVNARRLPSECKAAANGISYCRKRAEKGIWEVATLYDCPE